MLDRDQRQRSATFVPSGVAESWASRYCLDDVTPAIDQGESGRLPACDRPVAAGWLFAADMLTSVLAIVASIVILRTAQVSLRQGAVWLSPLFTIGLFDEMSVSGVSSFAADLVAALKASVVGLVTMLLVVPLLLGGSGLRAGALLGAILVVTRPVVGALVRTYAPRATVTPRVVVLGTGDEFDELRADIARRPIPLATDVLRWHDVIPADIDDAHQWFATEGVAADHSGTIIVLGEEFLTNTPYLVLLSRLEDSGAALCSLDGFYERHLGRTRARPGERLVLLRQIRRSNSFALFKAVVDRVAALVGMVVLAVVFAPIAAMVKITSPGPVLFRQSRVGLNNAPFTLVKFRTMRTDSELDGVRFATANDARCTRIGRYLRRARLDELPQMWNVLRGEMSIVGPRPERPEVAEQLSAIVPAYGKRTLVRPGLTGWAQVNQEYAATIDDHIRKLERDLYYIRHQSATLDLQVLVRTLLSAPKMRGR